MFRKLASITAIAIASLPMIALNANMPAANAQSSSMKITFFNQGGYVADYQISYSLNGQMQTLNARKLGLGQKQTFGIPANSKNVRIRGQVYTGLLWEPTRRIFDQSLRVPPAEVCFKTYGTTLAAKWDNQCTADF